MTEDIMVVLMKTSQDLKSTSAKTCKSFLKKTELVSGDQGFKVNGPHQINCTSWLINADL